MPLPTLRSTAKTSLRAVCGCALAIAVILAWTPARAGDDDDVAPDIKFLRGILEGIGLQSGREKGIDYRERSPLVIPPSNALLPPEADTAAKNPNWPVDPEVKRQRQLRALERKRGPNSSSEEFITDSRPLLPSELDKGPSKNSARNAGAMSPEDSARPFTPSQLGTKPGGILSDFFGKKSDDEKAAAFTGEPPRASLTDPPAGYMTPSPTERYGKTKEIWRPKAQDYYETHGTADVNH